MSLAMSCVIHVNFKVKQVIREDVEIYDKMRLRREGLIDFERLMRKGEVHLVENVKAS